MGRIHGAGLCGTAGVGTIPVVEMTWDTHVGVEGEGVPCLGYTGLQGGGGNTVMGAHSVCFFFFFFVLRLPVLVYR